MSDTAPRYRIEPCDDDWALVRVYDDELMSVYGTKAEAESVLAEANNEVTT